MSSNTPEPRGAGRGPRRAGSTTRASASLPSRPCSRASRCGFFPFLPRLSFRWGSLDLLPSAGTSSEGLPFLLSKIAPTTSSPEAKLVVISNSSFESAGGLRPNSRTRSWHVVPSRKACTISDCATLGSSVQRLEKRRMKSTVPGVPRAHIRALEVAHERADQVVPVMDLTGRHMFEPRPG
jgi:hypothetical protein